MGSFNKRMKRKQLQAETDKNKQQRSELETKLSNQIKAKQYDKALDTLAELVKSKNVSPEAMYEGALAYFMLGDYDRAATWVNNTLSFASGHVRARLLLARICMQQDRRDDAYAVIDFILDKGKGSLRDDEMDEIKNILGVCSKGDRDRIRKSFPNVAEVLDQVAVETGNTGLSEDASELLAKLKAKIADKTETVRETAVREASERKAGTSELLQALKEKVSAINSRKEAEPEDDVIEAEVVVEEPETAKKQSLDEIADNIVDDIVDSLFEKTVSEKTVSEAENPLDEADEISESEESADESEEVSAIIEEVLSRKIPAMEKVRVLNAYAGDYYYKNQLDNAKTLLESALELDIDDNTLKNLAVLYHDMGEGDKAVELASQMHFTDFSLLRILKND